MNKHNKQSKTQTIKKRAIYVYLPSKEMTTKWKNKADKQNISISKFVIEHVENSLRQEEGEETFSSRIEIIKEQKKLKQENKDLRKKNNILETVTDRLETELRQYRMKPFIQQNFTGTRQFETILINLFKEKKEIRKENLLDFLNIEPHDSTAIKGINQQIQHLEQYGLLKDMGGKWRWNG